MESWLHHHRVPLGLDPWYTGKRSVQGTHVGRLADLWRDNLLLLQCHYMRLHINRWKDTKHPHHTQGTKVIKLWSNGDCERALCTHYTYSNSGKGILCWLWHCQAEQTVQDVMSMNYNHYTDICNHTQPCPKLETLLQKLPTHLPWLCRSLELCSGGRGEVDTCAMWFNLTWLC